MLLELILPFSLILPGLWVLRLGRVNVYNNVERLSLSYILSLAMMFSLLYLGSLINAFDFASFVVLAITVVSFIHLFLLFVTKFPYSLYSIKTSLSIRVSAKLVVIISTIGLIAIYVMFLTSKAILDSDVVTWYLPIAREIAKENGFTYTTGYEYSVFLKPIGASVLYAWTYVVSGSTLSETFRLIPLVPILMLILLNYAIAALATKSQTIGVVSTAVFLVLPFHDRFFLYSSFYPDVFYYPLIFTAIYFLLEYFQSKRDSLLFWTGVGFGAAGLLKAQTIYFLIAFLLVFVVLELRSFKKLSAALCMFAPFFVLVPSILADSIQRKGFLLSIPSFTGMQLGLLLFLSTLSGVCYCATIQRRVSKTKIENSIIIGLVKRIAFLLLPFAALSSLWYLNNLLRFGTLVWTSSINLPNYDWALGVLKSIEFAQPTAETWHYIGYFIFMFVDPAVMGFAMLIPLLAGVFFVFRKRLESLKLLLFFGVISASVILSGVTILLPSARAGYNPRDILPMAPLLTTLSAIGIVSTTSNFCKKGDDVKTTFVSLLLVAYFGSLSYIHSVYVWYISPYHATAIAGLMSAFGYIVGLNLGQTSFQQLIGDRSIFVCENILRFVLLSLVVGIPVLTRIIYGRYKLLARGCNMTPGLGTRSKNGVLELPSRLCSLKQWGFVKSVFVISLMLSIIIIPRVEMLIVQGGPEKIKEKQLEKNYGNAYELFANPSEVGGGILTFKTLAGLPYYLPSVRIIDLKYTANLAFLRDCFQSITPYESIVKLKEKNIHYLFINPSVTLQLDASLNFTLSKIIRNPGLAILSRTFGSWQLYTLGPYIVEKTSIPLSGWNMDLRYTNADYVLNSTESSLYLQLNATDTDSKVVVRNLGVPKLNLSDYDYVYVEVEGSGNARINLRFFLDDGSSFDVVYWKDPYTFMTAPFDLRPYFEKTLRGDAYIGLKSSDETSSAINILEIFFAKIKG